MFNRQHFNRGKFNVSSAPVNVTGTVSLGVKSSGSSFLVISAPLSRIDFKMNLSGKERVTIYAPPSSGGVELGIAAHAVRRFFTSSESAPLSLEFSIEYLLCKIFAPEAYAETALFSSGESIRRMFATESPVPVSLHMAGQGTRILFTAQSICSPTFALHGASIRRYFALPLDSAIKLHTKASAIMFGYVTIQLPGLVLPPEGDLIIDTEQMTVTLNGQDVTRYFGADSEFFRLRPGENIIIHDDGANTRNLSYKILWKDMWL